MTTTPFVHAPGETLPIARGSMVPLRWAGSPWRRLPGLARRRDTAALPAWAEERRAHLDRLRLRRVALLVLIVAGALAGTQVMLDILPHRGTTPLELAIAALFAVLFGWISAGFWTAVMGAWVLWRGGDRHALTRALRGVAPDTPIDPSARTAIVMPICNEPAATVFGGLRATFESLARTGHLDRFEFFVLSDSHDPALLGVEQQAFLALRESLGEAGAKLHYRWRRRRTKRKAGNVADFCRRWGRLFRYMVVLDADSVMSGECLVSLVRLMEAHPDAGIIQTAPRAGGHATFHARVQQFGSRLYGPLFTAGMHFWQLGESHYWGHNAILRVAPFMKHCALAPLPGRGSLSGEILSHDFVEAALMRRAGWKVWVAYDLPGSWEQLPPNLVAEVMRDRRWCQGNLQNSRLMFEPGLHPVHRSVFLTGALAYLSAPLWLGFLLLSTLLFAQHALDEPKYFIEPYQLFPIWPSADLRLMLTLFGLTASLLLVPKLLALLIVLARGQAREFGGLLRLLVGAVVEFLHSMLLAPVRMLFHSQFVLTALTGWKLDWKSPPRDDEATTWREAWSRHGSHTVFALVWVGAILASGAVFPWWLSPVIGGLLLAVPLSVWTSRRGAGLAFRRAGLLLTPEERQPPAELVAAARHAEAFAQPQPAPAAHAAGTARRLSAPRTARLAASRPA